MVKKVPRHYNVTPKVDGKENITYNEGPTRYELTHTTVNPAWANTNRSRTTLGVGEEVNLSGWPRGTEWKTTTGGVTPHDDGTCLFTAP
jgi:hypothetical protein